MDRPHILCVNPPIHDFTAHDFWLKPYGLLRVAGRLRGCARLSFFDYLDRHDPRVPPGRWKREDRWGRGQFCSTELPRPAPLAHIRRRFRRFGLPRECFREFLAANGPFDFALVQTVMTYWYPGAREVLEDLRALAPSAKIVLGGMYATLCADHAAALGADLVVQGSDLEPLWRFLGVPPAPGGTAWWEAYPSGPTVGVLKLSDGCPFRCTYCSVPNVYPPFAPRPAENVWAELELLLARGACQIAFYDDALLYRPAEVLEPFLRRVLERGVQVNLHTPNALNARFVTPELARLMVAAGFRTFYLGLESTAPEWQQSTGGKVANEEFARAVEALRGAGAGEIGAYVFLGHPRGSPGEVEAALRFAHGLRVRTMLAEFSPIPGTPDGEACRKWVDLDEPLTHNKTAFPLVCWGEAEVERSKELCRKLNRDRDP